MPADSLFFNFEEDKKARSLSFYSKNKSIKLDQSLIEKLVALSAERGFCNARLCLHQSAQDLTHEMLILEYNNHYCRPHRHIHKSESIHLIQGQLAVITFDDTGNINHLEQLTEKDCFLYRIGSDIWHTVVPVSNFVIYVESKSGPFNRDQDQLYPDWAPDDTDPLKGLKFIKTLLER